MRLWPGSLLRLGRPNAFASIPGSAACPRGKGATECRWASVRTDVLEDVSRFLALLFSRHGSSPTLHRCLATRYIQYKSFPVSSAGSLVPQRWGDALRTGYVTMVENQQAQVRMECDVVLRYALSEGAEQASGQGRGRVSQIAAARSVSSLALMEVFWELGATSRFNNFRPDAQPHKGTFPRGMSCVLPVEPPTNRISDAEESLG